MIIAIDGTASSGKSTISRELGKTLGVHVLGTGSLYRAITLKTINLGIAPDDDARIEQMLESTILESRSEEGQTTVLLDGIVQSRDKLNSPEVSDIVATISAKEYVRKFVRKIQRQEAERFANIIVEGRDIGSVVFPDADIKLFIDADIKTRALRRQADYEKAGKEFDIDKVIESIRERDEQDREREISPLIMTSESIIVDTSQMSVKESVDHILKILSDRRLNLS